MHVLQMLLCIYNMHLYIYFNSRLINFNFFSCVCMGAYYFASICVCLPQNLQYCKRPARHTLVSYYKICIHAHILYMYI